MPRLGPVNQIELWLKAGEVQARVTRQAAIRTEFSVKSLPSAASVRGTDFIMRVYPSDASETLVYEGQVLVTHAATGTEVLLNAGEKVYATVETINDPEPLTQKDIEKFTSEEPETKLPCLPSFIFLALAGFLLFTKIDRSRSRPV